MRDAWMAAEAIMAEFEAQANERAWKREHNAETFPRKYRCPWCEKDFTGEDQNDCPDGCGHKCSCGKPASAHMDLFGKWMCDECRNQLGQQINSYRNGD